MNTATITYYLHPGQPFLHKETLIDPVDTCNQENKSNAIQFIFTRNTINAIEPKEVLTRPRTLQPQ